MRVLVAIVPLAYRELVALNFARLRPHLEVRVAAPEDLDLEVGRFEPHLVVCNEATEAVRQSILSWVQIFFVEDGLDALVSVSGRSSEVHDVSIEDLIRAVDETERMVS